MDKDILTPNWDARADINKDGVVNFQDLYLVAVHYGEKY